MLSSTGIASPIECPKASLSPSDYSAIAIIPYSAASDIPEENKYNVSVKTYEALEGLLDDQAGLLLPSMLNLDP